MRRLLVSAAAVAVAGVLGVAGVSAASPAADPAAPVQVTAGAKSLDIEYQVQENGYWCGPAAARIAMSAQGGTLPSQGDLAAQMGTTENGTDHISQVSEALKANTGKPYGFREMPNDPPSQGEKDQLWGDIVADIDGGVAMVANIVAPPGNQPPGYPSDQTIYHYFTVVGYNADDRTVQIADPANFGGNQIYWLSFDQLASLIPPKGYAF